MTVLVVCLMAAAFMAGLSWFVGVVHYPLFTAIGPSDWGAYHRGHTDRTTLVVIGPMVVQLATAGWLVADRPDAMSAGVAAAGLALALGTWVLTARAAALHRRFGAGPEPGAHRSLLAVHHARTALWSAHAALLAVVVASAAG